MKTRILLIAGPLVVALALAAATLPGSASSAAAEAGGLTVLGTASVSSAPDRAELSFGVESQGATARAAIAANAAEMRKVLAALKAAGATDLRTQSVSLSPRHDDRAQPTGFVALNTVSATILQLAKTGAVIDAAVEAGANQIHGPSLSAGDRAADYRQALKLAVANARANAQVLAAAANVSLGRVTAVVEGGGGSQPIGYAMDKAGSAESTPIEGGTQQTTATVTVTFSVS